MCRAHVEPARPLSLPPPSMPRLLRDIAADARFALRYFARHKGTTAIIIAVLALGTGANTVIFSLYQSQFVRPAPAMPDNADVARIWGQERPTTTANWKLRGFTAPELDALSERRDVLSAVGAWTAEDVVLRGDSTVARAVEAQFVTTNYFAVAGVPLVAGVGFPPDEGAAPNMTAVMSFLEAESRFGSASAAVGRDVLVNEVPVTIVGVAPPRFQGAELEMDEPALFMPLGARALTSRVPARWVDEDPRLQAFGRLAAGASLDQASQLAQQVATNTLPDSAARVGLARMGAVVEMNAPPPGTPADALLALVFLSAIGILILFVAWMNVGSLMVAAAVGRRHEIAVRLSLGASRLRLLRQLVTESTVLALVGSAIGLLVATWLLTWNQKVEIDGSDIVPDLGTYLFVLGMALGTGILFGLSPALHATRGRVAGALRDSGSGASSRSRLQRGFVVAQIALSQPLLVLLGTMLSLVITDYRPLAAEMAQRVITVQFRPIENGAPEQRAEAVRHLLPRIAERPEVLAVAPVAAGLDIRGIAPTLLAAAVGDSAPPVVHVEGTVPGWFTLVDVPVILGRDVSYADTAAADHPVVIGSDLARSLWGDANPIGRTIASPPIGDMGQTDSIALTVVGVYDATYRLPGMSWGGYATTGSMTESATRIFTARGQHWRKDQVLVRTRGPAAPFVPELQKFLRAAAPTLPVSSATTLAQIDEDEYNVTMRMSALVGAGGLLALLLASLGLYGVVSLAVRQRTREIGVRIAVGAEPVQVARMFLRSGVMVSLVALAIGLPASVAVLKIALSQGVIIAPGTNPYLIGTVIAALLVGVAAAATWVPARRASSVDPAVTLRTE